MRIINFLLFWFYFGYFFVLFSRVVGNRNPVDPVFLTSLILGIATFRQFISWVKHTYQSSRFYKGPSEKMVKVLLLVDRITTYIDVEFLQRSLNNKKVFNLFFYQILVISRKLVNKKSTKIFLIPWFFCMSCFFIEILLGTNLFLTLYCLSTFFLIKQLLYLFLYLAQMKYIHLNIIVFQKNLAVLNEQLQVYVLRDFTFMNYCLLQESRFQNKKMIRYFWDLSSEITYNHLKEVSLHVERLAFYKPLDKFLRQINICVFGFSLVYLLSRNFFEIPDIALCFGMGLMLFAIFLVWLSYLCPDPEIKDLLDKEINLYSVENAWSQKTKDKLLAAYPFITSFDLSSFSDERSALELSHVEFEPSQNLLTDQEKLVSTEIQQKLTDWFYESLYDEKIDPITYAPISNK